ncbi:hypothetical protein CYMTET_47212 [Cymbomonas tetramitiformis]|uniref:Uncharacterized protein n=1 Tax=Cymbomonas tetramitiformis TaxID=36881 RepID=A0AAE0BWN6_9CHLO|nr:hypothetical protein CYMTET_47212 [Cymbomonas tetramitiformis]
MISVVPRQDVSSDGDLRLDFGVDDEGRAEAADDAVETGSSVEVQSDMANQRMQITFAPARSHPDAVLSFAGGCMAIYVAHKLTFWALSVSFPWHTLALMPIPIWFFGVGIARDALALRLQSLVLDIDREGFNLTKSFAGFPFSETRGSTKRLRGAYVVNEAIDVGQYAHLELVETLGAGKDHHIYRLNNCRQHFGTHALHLSEKKRVAAALNDFLHELKAMYHNGSAYSQDFEAYRQHVVVPKPGVSSWKEVHKLVEMYPGRLRSILHDHPPSKLFMHEQDYAMFVSNYSDEL